jgi:pimeloyl-ACP methyl ester carboxylesterase
VTEPLPIVLVPGLLTSPRLYAAQLPALWQHGPVTIASTASDHTIAAIARRILADGPPRFALAGLSMGGYICFELLRRAPDRIARLALLNTTARPDTPRADPTPPRADRPGLQRPLRRGGLATRRSRSTHGCHVQCSNAYGQRFLANFWQTAVRSPPPESNRRPHPYHESP